ncbi:amidohydrolase family protein [Peribacillus muralis]|uniref:adenine deaminase C-terminal domain-containing protein n=1 Tax=Peribacillus muralis TaxID=264697 RepID=UPI001F4E99ED|nr:adenine deaminase C-terminal domain-containing protein [Peribacillus muralis]MCK1993438.1 amidohydrolase family protein [Peribacillus muralis]MCK2014274.1 amidohydrolase family protein [Peribacillus muralis]
MQTDLLISDVLVYSHTLKSFVHGNVAVLNGKFLYIGEKGKESFQANEVVAGQDRYMIPGLIDIHLHIESTMVTPPTFSHGLIPNGVTTIVADPHEMANVFGMKGIQEMIRMSKDCVADIFYGIPSSVPATTLETTGGVIGISEIDELVKEKQVICLGEVMDYAKVISEPNSKINQIVRHVKENYPHLPIEGHCPKLMDVELSSFIFAGIDSDHTQQTIAGMNERMRLNMFIELQEKSMNKEIIQYLAEQNRGEYFCFVTDDVMPDSFVEKGHLNHLVKKAILLGLRPEDAIYASTVTPAKRMRMYDRGLIAPNKIADFLLIENLEKFDIQQVYKNGQKVFDQTQTYKKEKPMTTFPDEFYQSIKIPSLTLEDFTIHTHAERGKVACRVMVVSDGTTFTKEVVDLLQVKDKQLQWEESKHCLVGVFERYGINGNKALGLVSGDTIKKGAIASTYSHDNHNLLVVAKNKKDAQLAANTIIENQGGFCIAEDGKVLSFLKLPVGGILSEAPLDQVAREMKELRKAMESLGYKHYNPIMSFSTHSLPVSPELKITDLGLVKVNESEIVPLII